MIILSKKLFSEDSSLNENVKLALKLLSLRSLSCFVSSHVVNHAPHLYRPFLLTWCWFGLFCFQNNEENYDKAITEVADHIGRQKATEEKVLNSLLDQMKFDEEILLEQKLALNEEAQHGLTQVNGFLQEDLKVDVPTGI